MRIRQVISISVQGAIGLAVVFTMPEPAPAQAPESRAKLPLELQVILAEYQKKRAEGLTGLYQRTIASLREAQAPFLRDGKLKESTAIETKIKELEEKIAALSKGEKAPAADAGKPPQ